MEARQTPFDTTNRCPDCDKATHVVKLGPEPAREVCPDPCSWEGETLE